MSSSQREDVSAARELLTLCSRYYRNGDLYPDCWHEPRRGASCRHLPRRCAVYNAVYAILHYLADADFANPEVSGEY